MTMRMYCVLCIAHIHFYSFSEDSKQRSSLSVVRVRSAASCVTSPHDVSIYIPAPSFLLRRLCCMVPSPGPQISTQLHRYLHIYISIHLQISTWCLHHQISYILLGTGGGHVVAVWRPLQVCSLDLVIYCHVFTNPSRAELGTGRGQILADC